MKIINHFNNYYLLRFDAGEEVIAGLTQFAKQHNVFGATFSAIGAAKYIMLSYYHLEIKHYEDREISQHVEIIGVLGSIAILHDDIVIHCHGGFADRNFNVVGGHIKKLVVSATCEISLQTLEDKIERNYDTETELNLLK